MPINARLLSNVNIHPRPSPKTPCGGQPLPLSVAESLQPQWAVGAHVHTGLTSLRTTSCPRTEQIIAIVHTEKDSYKGHSRGLKAGIYLTCSDYIVVSNILSSFGEGNSPRGVEQLTHSAD